MTSCFKLLVMSRLGGATLNALSIPAEKATPFIEEHVIAKQIN